MTLSQYNNLIKKQRNGAELTDAEWQAISDWESENPATDQENAGAAYPQYNMFPDEQYIGNGEGGGSPKDVYLQEMYNLQEKINSGVILTSAEQKALDNYNKPSSVPVTGYTPTSAFQNPNDFFKGSYNWVMDPNQYAAGFTNINPYTGMALTSAEQAYLQGQTGYGQNVSNINDVYKSIESYLTAPNLKAIDTAGNYNPNAYFSSFINQANPLAALVLSSTNPYQQALMKQAKTTVGNTTQDIASQFSNMKALNSSAMLNAASKAAADVYGGVASQVSGVQQNLYGNLLNSLMANTAEQYKTAGGLKFDAAKAAADAMTQYNATGISTYLDMAKTYNDLAAQNLDLQKTGLGAKTSLSAPDYVAPEIDYTKSGWENLQSGIGTGAAAAGTILEGLSGFFKPS